VAECDYQLAVRDCGEGYFQPGHTGPVVYADGSVETEWEFGQQFATDIVIMKEIREDR
jgi:hypothetical protein